MEDLSLHMLDIAENSINAGATRVEIRIKESVMENMLAIEVSDNGRGMDREMLEKVADPFFTTQEKWRSFGLGIPLLKQSAEECGGEFSIESEPGRGTTLRASFALGHIDRKPIGDIGATIVALAGGHPEADYLLVFEKDGSEYRMDTAFIRKELGDVPINVPQVLLALKEEINEALRLLGASTVGRQ
jgi:hypothetical protein